MNGVENTHHTTPMMKKKLQEQPVRRKGGNKSKSKSQLLGLLILASSGVIMAAVSFHWNEKYHIPEKGTNLAFQMHKQEYQANLRQLGEQSQGPQEKLDEKPKEPEDQSLQPEPDPRPQTNKESEQLNKKEEPQGLRDGGQLTQLDSATSKQTPSLEECLSLNSKAWIDGPRMGNSQKGHLTSEMAYEMILNNPPLISLDGGGSMHFLLKQSICHEQSRFMNWTDEGSEGQTSINFWAVRLMYLSHHLHQHKQAMQEAQLRKDLGCDPLLQKEKGIGAFDYECPNAKFLVVPMGEMGLGAVMRLGAVNAFIAGMSTNRTVLLVNNATVSDKSVQKPWIHSSCERRDIQCFFMPPSPCTITVDDLANGHILVRGEARKMFKFGELPPEHENDKVVVANFVLRPKHVSPTFVPNMVRQVRELIEHVRKSTNGNDARIELMEKAIEMITDDTPFDQYSRYYYSGVESKIHHSAVFYAMRPNPFYAEKLDRILSQIIPEDFNPELSFGLPVRASDKCIAESECLSFPSYMRLMGQIWTTHQTLIGDIAGSHGVAGNLVNSIVLTTESQSVLNDMHSFEKDADKRKSVPFNYSFVTNHHDVMQSTGLPSDFMKLTEDVVKEDDIMLSAVSSLKAQLMAKFTVANCCSNFHLLLFDFLQSGCGAAKDNIGQCLQDNEDPEFRVCCMWSKSEECAVKSAARKEREEKEKAEKAALKDKKKRKN